MARTTTERNTAIDYINRDIVNIKTELQSLSKLIRDGNGQPSLMQQVTTLSNEIVHLESEIKKDINELKSHVTYNHIEQTTKSQLSWQFRTAIIVALITSITSIIVNFYK
jgi:hypothetical protein